MRLVRFGAPGEEKPGLLDARGMIRDLSDHLSDISVSTMEEAELSRLKALDVDRLPLVDGAPRIGVPVAGIRKFIAIGINYVDHAKETNSPLPKEPVVFTKAISCLNGPNDQVMLPEGSKKGDWEVELGVVIGRAARAVTEDQAMRHVAGYCLVNDVSEREWQMERGLTWDKGKGFDTFGPVGPWLVTADEIQDPQDLNMWLDVNGVRMQSGSTRNMIFNVAQIVSYVSRCFTLWPGDLICTGTPPGVGMGRTPPVFLKPGDVMSLGIDKLGEQRQPVVAWKP